MINFADLFNENYQYSLKNIDYKLLTSSPLSTNVEISIKDNISYEIKNNIEFVLLVDRKISFEPNQLYELSVCFSANLTIKDTEKIRNVTWDEELKSNPVLLNIIQGLLSRISMLIAQVTSSYGQNPLVTPPNII